MPRDGQGGSVYHQDTLPMVLADQEQDIDMAFLQVGAPVPGSDGVIHDDITCFGCQAKYHYRNKCPVHVYLLMCDDGDLEVESNISAGVVTDDEANNYYIPIIEEAFEPTSDSEDYVFHSFGFLQTKHRLIDPYLILLDSESTVCTMRNKCYVKNIREHCDGKKFNVHTNGGN